MRSFRIINPPIIELSAESLLVFVDQVGQASGNSYSANGCLYRNWSANSIAQGVLLSQIEYPSAVAILVEEGYLYVPTASSNDAFLSPTADSFSLRHTNGSNVDYVDGHVKWLTAGKLSARLPSEVNPNNSYSGILTAGESTTACP